MTRQGRAAAIPDLLTSSPVERPWYERDHFRFTEVDDYLRMKRALDVGLCLAALPILLPVLALCCLVIILDSPGPPLFAQMRTGAGGRRFEMYKLRTMSLDAEERKRPLGKLNQVSWPDFKISQDPRITRVGRFFRKTSLDELPQIFNVLVGEMSLVGPRPTSFSSSTYSSWHTARLDVQPGLTGLWQVEGRNDLDFDDRVRLDIAYARHRSPGLDLQILARTVPRVLSCRGAY